MHISSEASRPTWDEYGLLIANAASTRGDCRRSKVGAVLFDTQHIVISTGYNGVAAGAPGCLAGACPRGLESYEDLPQSASYTDERAPCIARHAEDNAIRSALKAGQIERLPGSTCAISRDPCDSCRSLLGKWAVARAVWPDGELWL